jgi:hypothetical protein
VRGDSVLSFLLLICVCLLVVGGFGVCLIIVCGGYIFLYFVVTFVYSPVSLHHQKLSYSYLSSSLLDAANIVYSHILYFISYFIPITHHPY